MAKDSDDVPTRIIKRQPALGLGGGARAETPTEPAHRPAVDIDPEQVVTRRIPRPERKPAEGGQPAAAPAAATADVELPAGWLTVVKGPGRGRFRPIAVGMNSLGRDSSNRMPLDFGDEMISRADHAFVVYDDEQRTFWVQHGGKSNLVRLNGDPVLAPSKLNNGDIIRVGSTELRFTAFCDAAFNWAAES